MKNNSLIFIFLILNVSFSYSQTDSCYVIEITQKTGESFQVWGKDSKQHFLLKDRYYVIKYFDGKVSIDKILDIKADSLIVEKCRIPDSLLTKRDRKRYLMKNSTYAIADIKRVYLGKFRFAKSDSYIFKAVKIPCLR